MDWLRALRPGENSWSSASRDGLRLAELAVEVPGGRREAGAVAWAGGCGREAQAELPLTGGSW